MSNGVLHRTSKVDRGMVKPLLTAANGHQESLLVKQRSWQKDWINQRRYAAKEAWNRSTLMFRNLRVRAYKPLCLLSHRSVIVIGFGFQDRFKQEGHGS
jgi:hypothetical protein